MHRPLVSSLVCLLLASSACTSGTPHRLRHARRTKAAPATATSTPATSTPTASTPPAGARSFPTVGALFPHGITGPHTCTASVLASRTGDTIITAAHCVSGTPTGLTFVPGYDKGRAPYGTWQVTAAYVSAGWQHDRSPEEDYAVLTVAPHTVQGRRIEIADATGSELLGHAPAPGTTVTVVAYNHGIGDDPVACQARVFLRDNHYPTFDCHGFVGGSSGSPWLTTDPATAGWVLRGVIGGPNQGGCFEYRSHTSVFTDDVVALLGRAQSHDSPDSVVSGGDNGC
jgi:hypothetical protein